MTNLLAPKTLEDCQHEIDQLRLHSPDFDLLFVDALHPETGTLIARLRCQFRAPYSCGVQTGALLPKDPSDDAEKWQYRFSITADGPAHVLHAFLTEYSAMKTEPSLSYTDRHDKMRDEQLRQQAESTADEDARFSALLSQEPCEE